MKNCKAARAYARHVAWMVGLMVAVSVQALDTLPLLPSGAAQTLLEQKKPIRAEAAGMVPAEYGAAMLVFESPTLLTDVQAAYAALLPEGEKPEFLIQQAASKAWFYVNRKGERTDITEIARKQTSDTTFDIIYYSAGKRFFGNYQAVIHVQISKEAEQTRYVATVYAYPENAFSRFFARRLGLVERFFKKKTAEMSGIISAITCNLCEKAEESAGSVATHPPEDSTES